MKNTITTATPVSVAMSKGLKARLARYAIKHEMKVSTAIRTLAEQRLNDLEEKAEQAAAEAWQAEQAAKTYAEILAGKQRTIPVTSLEDMGRRMLADAVANHGRKKRK